MPTSKKISSPPQSEIRIDYIHDREVIIAPGRRKRPHDTSFVAADSVVPSTPIKDAFSRENLASTKAVFTVGGSKNWRIKVIKNIYPVLRTDNPKAYGYQEVVVETPEYGVELGALPVTHVADLLRVYGERVKALQRDKKIRYILVFKNNGGSAGASINHAHSQIFASAYVPSHIVLRRKRAQEYRVMNSTDYYSDLLLKEERGPRWIGSGAHMCALTPYASLYNYETWIMPWRRVDNIAQLTEPELREMAALLRHCVRRLNAEGLPYNYYLHQVVGDQFEHLYLRIAPRRDVWAGLELGSRLIVNTVPPEEAAEFYREGFPTISKL